MAGTEDSYHQGDQHDFNLGEPHMLDNGWITMNEIVSTAKPLNKRQVIVLLAHSQVAGDSITAWPEGTDMLCPSAGDQRIHVPGAFLPAGGPVAKWGMSVKAPSYDDFSPDIVRREFCGDFDNPIIVTYPTTLIRDACPGTTSTAEGLEESDAAGKSTAEDSEAVFEEDVAESGGTDSSWDWLSSNLSTYYPEDEELVIV